MNFDDVNKKYLEIENTLHEDTIIEQLLESFSNTQIILTSKDILEKNESLIKDISGEIGLYYFEVKKTSKSKTWDDLKSIWNSIKKTPNTTYRWEKHNYNDSDFFPFYIGKASKSISQRIHEHIFATTKKDDYLASTSTLRLKQHYESEELKEIMNCFEYRVSYVSLSIKPELLTIIEKNIRNKKNCMVGKH